MLNVPAKHNWINRYNLLKAFVPRESAKIINTK